MTTLVAMIALTAGLAACSSSEFIGNVAPSANKAERADADSEADDGDDDPDDASAGSEDDRADSDASSAGDADSDKSNKTGLPPGGVRENFVQGQDAPIDIALVVDSSPNIGPFQTNLAAKLAPLLTAIAKQDWRIAINTTDPEQGCMRALIRNEDADGPARFAQAVMAGDDGTGIEKSLFQARQLLSECGGTKPWLRPQSFVAVLVLTDSDNCSQGSGKCDNPEQTTAAFKDYFGKLRKLGSTGRVYGLIWHPSIANKCAERPAPELAQLIAETKGQWGPICQPDYSQILQQVSKDVGTLVLKRVTLKRTPSVNSVRITVDGKELEVGQFKVDGTSVEFTTPLAAGAKVSVIYVPAYP